MEGDSVGLMAALVAGGSAMGTSFGIAYANSKRRPAIDQAIDNKVALTAIPLAAKDEDQGREIEALKVELAWHKQRGEERDRRLAFLEQAILDWKPRKPEAPVPLFAEEPST